MDAVDVGGDDPEFYRGSARRYSACVTPRFPLILLLAAPLLAGDWTTRFDLTLDRILAAGPPRFDDAFVVADTVPQPARRFTNFSGDVSGRYIGALAAAAQHSWRSFAQLERIVTATIALQKPDGHFGAPMSSGRVTNDDMAMLWGNGRLLIGLLEYYAGSPRADVFAAARRLGDFLLAQAPRLNSDEVGREYNGEKFAVGYICWTSTLEGIVELHRVTHDARYLALAREIAARTGRHPSQHSHGFLSTVPGIVQLYRVTGERAYLDQARREWQGVIDSSNVLLQGAVPEMFAPSAKRDEGCSEADWLRLSLELWQITRDPECLRQAELTLFNEFAFNQFSNGDFGHHLLAANGVEPEFAHAWWCCTFHGLRAMAGLFRYGFHEQDGAVVYDIPIDAAFQTAGFAVRAESTLERDATVRLTVTRADAAPHTLRVRVPEWATEASFPGDARRVWKAGETVLVTYRLRTRTVERGKRVAIFQGPWLLAADRSTSPNYFDEPSSQNKVLLPAESTDTAAHLKVRYLPGGYPMQPASATLRPIAEYTKLPDATQMEFWLPR
jgi:DUF1680 family protein